MSSKHGDKNKSIMYRLLLLFITSLLISFSGFAQQTQSDSLQEVRKAQIEKARAAARAKAEARAAERAKMESEKQKTDKSTATPEKSDKKKAEADSKKVEAKADKANEKESKRERKAREKKADDAASKTSAKKEEPKPKKPSIKERNMKDTTVAKSKYGNGTFGWRGNIGASITWSDYSDRNSKIGFDSWGFVLYGGLGYRINHIAYAGITLDIEAVEMLSFSPMIDFVVTAPTPISPFVELSAGPYVSYNEYRKWVFQPRAGLSYRGKKNKIMRFGFGLRMYDDAFDSDTFRPQYAASVTAEF